MNPENPSHAFIVGLLTGMFIGAFFMVIFILATIK